VNAAIPPLFLGFKWDARAGLWRRLKWDKESSLLLTAPPGSGKFTRFIAPNLLTFPGSVLVYDPKGEAAAVTARYRRTLGPVYVIDPFSVLQKLGVAERLRAQGVTL